jgi:hypothetical protein
MDSSRQTASGSCRQLKRESEQTDRHPEFSKEEAWPTKTFSNWSSDARVVRFFHSFFLKAGAFNLILMDGINAWDQCGPYRFPSSRRTRNAPRPIFGMRRESALHRIQVHVAQLLDELLLTPEVEIVEPGLPDLRQGVVRPVEAKKRRAATTGGVPH